MKATSTNSQTVLAKLLSRENITVQHGNYTTAFFDVKSRVLGLPVWKDKGKDVYDMLVGHEVGHALYTPLFDPAELKVPHVYMNVVEDIRIERMIQSTYPGLIRCFQSAYSTLNAEDFFGIKSKDVNALGLADRINLKAKLGSLIDVQFSPDEADVVKQCFAVQTWDDTLTAAKALYDFCKDQANGQQQEQSGDKQPADSNNSDQAETQQDPTPSSGTKDDQSKQDQSKTESKQEQSKTESKQDQSKTDDGTQSKSKQDQSKTDSGKQDSSSSEIKSDDQGQQKVESNTSGESADSSGSDGSKQISSAPEVTTASNFDKMSKSLIDDSIDVLRTQFASQPSQSTILKQIVGYRELFKNRDESGSYNSGRVQILDSEKETFDQFMASNDRYVAVLKKEFEMRKAAYQYSRATTARTGVLNVDKLHSYRIEDDIFLSVTQLANAKSHGMVMFVDYSSSMASSLPYVLKHLITLITFCKSVNIPFQVYGFTSDHRQNAHDRIERARNNPNSRAEGEIGMDEVILLELASSEMSKSEYNRAIADLMIRTRYVGFCGNLEVLGGTPLNEALIAAHTIVKNFKAKHRVQKMTTIFLTDGEGHPLAVYSNSNFNSVRIRDGSIYSRTGVQVNLNGRTVRTTTNSTQMMVDLIENLRETTGTKVMGFFVPASIYRAANYGDRAHGWTRNKKNKKPYDYPSFSSELRKNKVVCMPGAYNYDEYYIVSSGRELDVQDEELQIDNSMGRNAIARAFKDFAKSKKVNRVFVTKFSEAIS